MANWLSSPPLNKARPRTHRDGVREVGDGVGETGEMGEMGETGDGEGESLACMADSIDKESRVVTRK